ncbi:MAG: FAD:protein FMN transferase [Actinomycetales bacterium]|nr:FAD:protein FMN transferase [Actinomycetales bacterium]
MITRAEPVMGTVVSFLVEPAGLADGVAEALLDEACAELHRLDDRFSAWKPASELSRIRSGDVDTPSALMREVIELCEVVRELTAGYFDPWSLPGGFDPTGLVKGWAAERALAVLADGGVTAALVNAGGDICVVPGATYDVGVQHPSVRDALCAVIRVDVSAATSGVYERGEHLRHPFGGPVAAVSATVVGGRLAIADAFATALAVGGIDVLDLVESTPGLEGFFITRDGVLAQTSAMDLGRDRIASA